MLRREGSHGQRSAGCLFVGVPATAPDSARPLFAGPVHAEMAAMQQILHDPADIGRFFNRCMQVTGHFKASRI